LAVDAACAQNGDADGVLTGARAVRGWLHDRAKRKRGEAMTHPSKRKGNGFEREVVRALRRAGVAAGRVPLSGQLPGFEDDVSVPVRGVERKLQYRRRRSSFTSLYDALAGHFGLVVRDDGPRGSRRATA
jgi:hypothetical protein